MSIESMRRDVDRMLATIGSPREVDCSGAKDDLLAMLRCDDQVVLSKDVEAALEPLDAWLTDNVRFI